MWLRCPTMTTITVSKPLSVNVLSMYFMYVAVFITYTHLQQKLVTSTLDPDQWGGHWTKKILAQ